jgi:hypothetical protein
MPLDTVLPGLLERDRARVPDAGAIVRAMAGEDEDSIAGSYLEVTERRPLDAFAHVPRAELGREHARRIRGGQRRPDLREHLHGAGRPAGPARRGRGGRMNRNTAELPEDVRRFAAARGGVLAVAIGPILVG